MSDSVKSAIRYTVKQRDAGPIILTKTSPEEVEEAPHIKATIIQDRHSGAMLQVRQPMCFDLADLGRIMQAMVEDNIRKPLEDGHKPVSEESAQDEMQKTLKELLRLCRIRYKTTDANCHFALIARMEQVVASGMELVDDTYFDRVKKPDEESSE